MKLWNFLAKNNLHILIGGDEAGYVASIAPFDGKILSIATGGVVVPRTQGLSPRKVLMTMAEQLERCRVVRTHPMKGSGPINTLTVD